MLIIQSKFNAFYLFFTFFYLIGEVFKFKNCLDKSKVILSINFKCNRYPSFTLVSLFGFSPF